MAKRGGLGRGLSALIPGAPEAGEASGLLEVPVNAVAPNPKQPRTHFDDETIGALAASIREVGILQPIVVRKVRGWIRADRGGAATPGGPGGGPGHRAGRRARHG